jgi:hypothetical protein
MTELGGQPTEALPVAQAAPAQHGEPCQECGAPLAADQRYCLNCGARRGDPRVDYRHYMATASAASGAGSQAAAAPSPPPPAAPEEADKKPERDYAPFAAVGGIAVLGLMLLVGVLIGRGGDSSAPTPTRLVVPSGGEAAEASAGGGEAGGKGAALSAGKGAAKSGGKGKGASLTGGGSGKEEEAVEASDEALESLQSESGASYEEQSKKLPNKIATPGKPPPIDKTTAPGGGEGGAEVIK